MCDVQVCEGQRTALGIQFSSPPLHGCRRLNPSYFVASSGTSHPVWPLKWTDFRVETYLTKQIGDKCIVNLALLLLPRMRREDGAKRHLKGLQQTAERA